MVGISTNVVRVAYAVSPPAACVYCAIGSCTIARLCADVRRARPAACSGCDVSDDAVQATEDHVLGRGVCGAFGDWQVCSRQTQRVYHPTDVRARSIV